MGFITEAGLDQLKRYQYKSGGYSWLDNKMNPFWVFCVELVPKWVAPNLLTFIGFAFMLASCIISISYDYTLTKTIPAWTFLFQAVGIFIYQTLDAIDGKQARRTGSSSPLGQLFDHGCDSFSTTFFILAIAQSTRIPGEYLFYVFLSIQIVLWGVQQKEHYTGVLHTHVYNIGVTEMEFFSIYLHLDFWEKSFLDLFPGILTNVLESIPDSINFFQTPMVKLVIYWFLPISFLVGLYMFIGNLIKAENKIRMVSEWIPMLFFWWLQFVWFRLPCYGELAGPILLTFGIIQSLIICKVIICSTTKDQFPLFHIETVPFFVISLIIYFQQPQVDQVKIMFWIALLCTVILCIRFLYNVINQITDFLGIYCFSIQKKKQN